jgi:hypothetical protein
LFHELTNRNGEDLSIWSKDDMELPSKHIESAPASSTSTSTSASNLSISSGSTTLAPSPSAPTYTPEGVHTGSDVTAALLTDGARAIRAISRPFPVATVGQIKKADFDIASTTFRLAVTVRPDDFTSTGISTEIYLPFIHYAKSLENQKAYHDDKKSDSTNTALELDVEIKTTEGSYTTRGQYLTWTYPAPRRETTYTIEIKRKGGVIVQDVGYAQASGSWSDVCGGCVIA